LNVIIILADWQAGSKRRAEFPPKLARIEAALNQSTRAKLRELRVFLWKRRPAAIVVARREQQRKVNKLLSHIKIFGLGLELLLRE
jgi:hypothetical protein